MPTDLITSLGERKLALAAGNATQVAISHVALGDGAGGLFDPWPGMTALRRERARRPIDNRYFLNTNAWMIRSAFPPDTPSFAIREIGYFDTDGDLIAVTAGQDMDNRVAGGTAYNIEYTLDFSTAVDGVITVDAPDDELVQMGIALLTQQSQQALQHFTLAEAWRARFGRYPGA